MKKPQLVVIALGGLLALASSLPPRQTKSSGNFLVKIWSSTPESIGKVLPHGKTVGRSGSGKSEQIGMVFPAEAKYSHLIEISVSFTGPKVSGAEFKFKKGTSPQLALNELGISNAKAGKLNYYTQPDEAQEQREAGNKNAQWEGVMPITSLRLAGLKEAKYYVAERDEPQLILEAK